MAARAKQRLLFAVLCTAVAVFALVQSMVSPILPVIAEELDADLATTSWVLTAYLLAASIATPITGRLGDAYGKDLVLVVSLSLLAVGSLLAALATDIHVLIAARVVQGLGGGVLPLSYGIVRDEFPRAKVTGAVSTLSSLMSVGFALGIVVCGPIVEHLGFEWLFWLPCGLSAAAAVAAWVAVPASPVRSVGRVPFGPAVLLATWLACLLLGLSHASDWGWGSGGVLGLFAAAAVIAVIWTQVEVRVRVPLIDMRMLRLRSVWTANLVALLMGFGLFASMAYSAQLAQAPLAEGAGFGVSLTETGYMLLPMAFLSFVMAVAVGPLVTVMGARGVAILGASITAASLWILTLAHDSVLQIAVVTGLFGVGVGMTFGCLATIVVGAVPAHQTGVATGMNANIRTIGGSLGIAVVTTVVTARVGATGHPDATGYDRGFAVLAVGLTIAALAALAIPRAGRRRRGGPASADVDVAAASAPV